MVISVYFNDINKFLLISIVNTILPVVQAGMQFRPSAHYATTENHYETCDNLPSVGYAWSFQGPELTGVTAVLQNENLWEKFAEQGTEMIITKVGRRMFPTLQVKVSGLEQDAVYFILMDMALAVDGRLKFDGSKWVRTARDDVELHHTPPYSRCYFHPDSPSTGAYWMTRPVSMQRAKMTNCSAPEIDNSIALMSMHKYQPRVHVIKASDLTALAWSPRATFTFPLTQFVAVTAYQSLVVWTLIDNVPTMEITSDVGSCVQLITQCTE